MLFFGWNETVKTFDKHHLLYRDYRYESSKAICQNILKKLIPELKSIVNHSKKTIQKWEKEFFEQNLRESLSSDLNETIKNAYRTYKHAKSLLKHWSI